MILVRQRQDLLDDPEGVEIPVKMLKGNRQHARIDKWMYASQPDELDDSEFNLVLYSKSQPHEVIGVAIAIDFDFKDDPAWNNH